MIEMEHGFLFMTGIADGSCLAVSATATADVGLVGYELAVAAGRIGALLTPALRLELQRSLPQVEPGIR
jgi:predicted regulator of Ras-like GTPase activity (Roadblock/LC7/MglB family)